MISPPGLLLGAARPRVELCPAAVDTVGPEAAELAARAGLPPEQWQDDGLDVMLSVRDDGLWACYEYAELVGRQEGKTTGLGVPRALAGLFLLGERLIMWTAHEVKTSMEAFLRVKDALATLGEQVNDNLIVVDDISIKVNNTNGQEGFTLSTGQRMRFVARSKGSGRGFSGDCVIIDEAFAYTREQQSALEPTLSARPNPQIVYLSSPPLDGRSGEVLYSLGTRAEKHDPTLGWRDWGLAVTLDDLLRMTAEDRAEFLDDRRNWAAALPALGRGRVTEESVARLRRSMDEFDFAREVLGCWPVQIGDGGAWQVITEDAWSAVADPSSTVQDPVVFAVDAAPERTTAAIGTAGRRADRLGHVEVVDARPGTGWLLERIVELNETHRPRAWVLDPASAAGSLLPALQERGIEPELVTGREMAQACGAFYEDVVERGGLRHLGQASLDGAVKGAKQRPLADAWAWHRRDSATDISPLVAVTLAWHGHNKHAAGGPPNLW